MAYESDFNNWGSSGEEPITDYSYAEGEQPVDAWDNWFGYNVINELTDIIDIINDIDSNTDGVVDEAESMNAYKGNDIDSDGDGTVNNTDKYSGVAPSDGSDGQILYTDGSTISWIDTLTEYSNMDIDVDKDWQTFDITNLGLLESPTIKNDNYVEGYTSSSGISGSHTIDTSVANTHRLSLDGDASIGFANVSGSDATQVTVKIVNQGGVPTFNNVRWPIGDPPDWSTSSGEIDMVDFIYDPVDDTWDGLCGDDPNRGTVN